jgi:predicted membrane protein
MVKKYHGRSIKMQTKKHSHYEVLTNQILGIVIGWLIVYFIFPLMGVETNYIHATASTVIFFISSYIRSYTVRRLFNKVTHG